jgi:hypothetical protein
MPWNPRGPQAPKAARVTAHGEQNTPPEVQVVIIPTCPRQYSNPLSRRRFTRRERKAPSSHQSSSTQYTLPCPSGRPSLKEQPPPWLLWDCHAWPRAVKIPEGCGRITKQGPVFFLTIATIEMTDSELAAPCCASRRVSGSAADDAPNGFASMAYVLRCFSSAEIWFRKVSSFAVRLSSGRSGAKISSSIIDKEKVWPWLKETASAVTYSEFAQSQVNAVPRKCKSARHCTSRLPWDCEASYAILE